MPTLADLRMFVPFVVIAFCLLIGRWMSTSPRIPNWLIPPTLAVFGVVVAGMSTAIGGGDARAAIFTGLSGLVAVGLHQNWRQIADRNEAPPILVPPDPKGPTS